MGNSGDNSSSTPSAGESPVEILQELVRFNTTNPPGDERACIEWIANLLSTAGFETELYARDPARPNLVAKLDGSGDASPLMLYGHVDVVKADAAEWRHDPFEGAVEDGFVWGRGTLDMKGPLAMMITAALRVAREGVELGGDLVVMALTDEEAGSDTGATYMVEEHPEVFADIDYAVGEFGGYSMELGGQRFYPIQMSEKIVCWSELTFQGPAGHGSLPRSGGAMADMARAVTALSESAMPVHVTPMVERMIATMSDEIDGDLGDSLEELLVPERAESVLDMLGEDGVMFDALLHNTVNPTVVSGGDKENVIPSEVTLTLDCRLLPGQTDTDLERELRAVIPEDIHFSFETVRYEPFPADADPDMFSLLSDILTDADPDGTPVPFVLFGGTDARHLAKAGVQSYGWTPMLLPTEFEFLDMIHAADERIPVDALEFGTERMFELLCRYDADAISD